MLRMYIFFLGISRTLCRICNPALFFSGFAIPANDLEIRNNGEGTNCFCDWALGLKIPGKMGLRIANPQQRFGIENPVGNGVADSEIRNNGIIYSTNWQSIY